MFSWSILTSFWMYSAVGREGYDCVRWLCCLQCLDWTSHSGLEILRIQGSSDLYATESHFLFHWDLVLSKLLQLERWTNVWCLTSVGRKHVIGQLRGGVAGVGTGVLYIKHRMFHQRVGRPKIHITKNKNLRYFPILNKFWSMMFQF